MDDYITVVSVDNPTLISPRESTTAKTPTNSEDSQFITVLSIGETNNMLNMLRQSTPELVLVYRLPGERLGFGLKFQGGTRSTEKIQRLFIQSCAAESPASRVAASWGFLREGDEIIEIDGEPVSNMTRIECVRCLKESNLAIKLLVRNREDVAKELSLSETDTSVVRKMMPPPPPPVPPRKINRRGKLSAIEDVGKLSADVEPPVRLIVSDQPADAEFYLNLLSDESDLMQRESESDETGSTISTVIDKFSVCSDTESMTSISSSTSNNQSIELAKAIKPFTMLEREYNVDSSAKLEECLMKLQPPVNFQDINGNSTENMVILVNHNNNVYENVTINNKKMSNDKKPVNGIEKEIEMDVPPKPLPRQAIKLDSKRKVVPSPRRSIHYVEVSEPIHECPLIESSTLESPEIKVEPTTNGSCSPDDDKPRLIEFTPKTIVANEREQDCQLSDEMLNGDVTPVKTSVLKPQCDEYSMMQTQCDKVKASAEIPEMPESSSDSDAKEEEDDAPIALLKHIQFTEDMSDSVQPVTKKCSKLEDNDVDDNYYDSSSDDDAEKVYEPEMMERRDSSDNLSDEDVDKLGPPELVNGPGPSEAYFNFHWSNSMLPTIGEVEEEFSSLEPQQNGPIVIIDNADESNLVDNQNKKMTSTVEEKVVQRVLVNKNDNTNDISEPSKLCNGELPAVDKTMVTSENACAVREKEVVTVETPTPSILNDMESEKVSVDAKIITVTEKVVTETNLEPTEIAETTENTQQNVANDNVVQNVFGQTTTCESETSVVAVGKLAGKITSSETLKQSQVDITTAAKNRVTDVDESACTNDTLHEVQPLKSRYIATVASDDSATPVKLQSLDISEPIVLERIILGIEHPTENCTDNQEMGRERSSSKDSIQPTMDLDSTQVLQANGDSTVTSDAIVSPPTFSRLPPDGHEFPPNFSEPLLLIDSNSQVSMSNDKIQKEKTAPPLPKSIPPLPSQKKIYRQDLVIKVDDTRQQRIQPKPTTITLETRKMDSTPDYRSTSTPWPGPTIEEKNIRKEIMTTAKNGPACSIVRRRSIENSDAFKKFEQKKSVNSITSGNWRKDEKSEKSVRDKIAMFSTEDQLQMSVERPGLEPKRSFNKSTENLMHFSEFRRDESLKKKAHSVENLDDLISKPSATKPYTKSPSPPTVVNNPNVKSDILMGKAFSVECLNSGNIRSDHMLSGNDDRSPSSAFGTMPRPRTLSTSLTRTTSFSGYTDSTAADERRRSSISNMLEQRKKSMSKLRGLVIPEKVPLGDQPELILYDLPEIKSRDATKIQSSKLSNNKIYQPDVNSDLKTGRFPVLTKTKAAPRKLYTSDTTDSPIIKTSGYTSIFTAQPRLATLPRALDPIKNQHSQLLPPIKPPRTSLIISKSNSIPYDSEDSDSLQSSRISSPPNSPVATNPPEKFSLTRTLSSETNTSIASSTTSTLTSGSAGSHASCSSIGSTPTIDMSRKIVKSSSNDSSSVNRKTILASAKCRSGRDDSSVFLRQRKYEDDDSTDGYEEEDLRRAPKPKQRNSEQTLLNNKDLSETKQIKYNLVKPEESLSNRIISVATYVEVTSETDAESVGSPAKISSKFIDEERRASFKADPQLERKSVASLKKTPPPVPQRKFDTALTTNSSATTNASSRLNEMAKWVRKETTKKIDNESAVNLSTSIKTPKIMERQMAKVSVMNNIEKFNKNPSEEPIKVPTPIAMIYEKPRIKAKEIRKTFEVKSPISVHPPTSQKATPITPTTTANITTNKDNPKIWHERFSSLDSIASTSSSSGVSSSAQTASLQTQISDITQQSTPSDFGSFSSFGSNHSLITAADIQSIIDDADPPLKTPEAFVVMLVRESAEGSVGITLAGGADYETKEITVHKVLSNSPAQKDGRLRKGDRILAINGLSMRGLTHRESVTVLKTPRTEVGLIVTRSESMLVMKMDAKAKRVSLGSLTSLVEKRDAPTTDIEKRKAYHSTSRSLDLDLDIVSSASELVAQESSSNKICVIEGDIRPEGDSHKIEVPPPNSRCPSIEKDSCGLGISIEGGIDSPEGNKPLTVKKVFMGGAAERTKNVHQGDVIFAINGYATANLTRIQAWRYMKALPNGPVQLVLL